MAEEFDQDERTEQATPRKRQQVRQKGQVARSQEINSVAVLFSGLLALMVFSSSMYAGMAGALRYNIQSCLTEISINSAYQLLLTNGMLLLKLIAPVLMFVAVVGILVNLAQVGFEISFEPLLPKPEKLDPIKGARRLFSQRVIFDLIRDSLKIVVIGYIAFSTLKGEIDNYIPLADQEVGQILRFAGKVALKVGLRVSGALLIIAILDYAFQRFQFERQIRMTRQELKEEYKLYEGDPIVKSRIKRIQRELARARMLKEVPKADVVVTNPTHLAVALKYDSETMAAPTVVAKGERLIAEKIKEVARQAGVPIIENPPLARALFEAVEVGMTIPAKLYRAVAELLAHVYKMKGKI